MSRVHPKFSSRVEWYKKWQCMNSKKFRTQKNWTHNLNLWLPYKNKWNNYKYIKRLVVMQEKRVVEEDIHNSWFYCSTNSFELGTHVSLFALWCDITKSYVYLRLQDVSPRGFSWDHKKSDSAVLTELEEKHWRAGNIIFGVLQTDRVVIIVNKINNIWDKNWWH